MKSDRFRFAPLALVFFIPLLLYVRWPSYQWNVDGVACAAALELGNPVYLFHADHLIYGGLGYACWKWLLAPLGVNRALPALQIMTLVMTVAGLIGLFLLMASDESRDRWRALTITLAIAVSAVVWVWSVEAQVYSLGFAALAWATYALLEGKTLASLRWAGIFSGIAILGHLMHVLWLVPAAYWISQETSWSPMIRFRRFATVALYSALTSALAYVLVFNLVLMRAGLSHAALMNWIKGSVGLTPDRHWAWHTGGFAAPFKWAYASLCFFWGSFWPYVHAPLHLWVWLLTVFSIAGIGLVLVASFWSSKSPRRNFALLWIGMYALLLWTWEPTTLCYRMTEGIPLAILLSLGLARIPERWGQLLVMGTLSVTLFLITWSTRIGPMNHPQNNALYVQTLTLADETPENSLYLTDGGVTWIYLLYFTGRQAWNVDLLLPAQIEGAIASYKKSGAVLLDMNVFREKMSASWVASHRWAPMENLSWLELQ